MRIGGSYTAPRPEMPLTVLRDGRPGISRRSEDRFCLCRQHGFDYVALVHGDGQYAAEELGRLRTSRRG